MLTYVPITRPKRPNTIRNMFLMNMIMQGPKSRFGQSTQISMIAGNAMPRADRQRAPNREMKRANLGTVMAKVTAKRIFLIVNFRDDRITHARKLINVSTPFV